MHISAAARAMREQGVHDHIPRRSQRDELRRTFPPSILARADKVIE
jgi:hypothetical protein